jgi:hypothetical protein
LGHGDLGLSFHGAVRDPALLELVEVITLGDHLSFEAKPIWCFAEE